MEVPLQPQRRALRRCYQCCRHEEQIWTLAYEQVYPQARRVLPVRQAIKKATSDERRSATRRG
jgi:hypothetical protein